MRKRNVQVLFRLNEEEAEYLQTLVKRSGRSQRSVAPCNGQRVSAL